MSGDEAFWADRIRKYMRGEHSPQHALPERAIFVAADGSEVVGFAAGHRTRRFGLDAELQWIDVAESMRRQGIASQLMARIGQWLLEQDTRRACVNVAAENVAAQRLYARSGARPLREGLDGLGGCPDHRAA